MSALDRKLQHHEDRCKTQMTAAGRDMPCTCDRDDALAELSALRERVEALEKSDADMRKLFIEGFSVNLRVVKGNMVIAECHDYSDPMEHRKTYGKGATWQEAISAALQAP